MNIRRCNISTAFFGLLLGAAVQTMAQPVPSYGTSGTTIYTVDSWAFTTCFSGASYSANGTGGRWIIS